MTGGICARYPFGLFNMKAVIEPLLSHMGQIARYKTFGTSKRGHSLYYELAPKHVVPFREYRYSQRIAFP